METLHDIKVDSPEHRKHFVFKKKISNHSN